jgi:hypothetical protein
MIGRLLRTGLRVTDKRKRARFDAGPFHFPHLR